MGEENIDAMQRETILNNRDALYGLREILLANVVMAAEIPAPTGSERLLTRFLSDRFTESGLNDIAGDQAGNIAAVLSGRDGSRNLLVAAHVDKVWTEAGDHTVSVGVGTMSGRGIADNSLGVAVLATLPLILERLEIKLDSNLILLGTTRSFGRGDLAGMRFFLENIDQEIAGALCIEGMDLGRLSFSSLGMARGEVVAEWTGGSENVDLASAGVIPVLNRLISEILELNRQHFPGVKILVGTVQAESGYNVPPATGNLRFEIRSENEKLVAQIEGQVASLVRQADERLEEGKVSVEMIAHRRAGELGADHPLVMAARKSLECLGVEPKVEPSISELAALLSKGIPSLTLGITRGANRHSAKESIEVEGIFAGLAQLIAVLQYMDANEVISS